MSLSHGGLMPLRESWSWLATTAYQTVMAPDGSAWTVLPSGHGQPPYTRTLRNVATRAEVTLAPAPTDMCVVLIPTEAEVLMLLRLVLGAEIVTTWQLPPPTAVGMASHIAQWHDGSRRPHAYLHSQSTSHTHE